MKDVYDLLAYEEGFRSRPYHCTEGYVTIGIGTKLHNVKNEPLENFPIEVDMELAKGFLTNEVQRLNQLLSTHDVTKIAYKNANMERKAIFLSMAYQIGFEGLLKFRKMWKYANIGSWQMAATEAWDSRWAKQTPERARRHVQVLTQGNFGIYN